MKALSIRQPWLWAILHANKRLENRDWPGCSYRGPVLLHASKSVGTLEEFGDAVHALECNSCPGPVPLRRWNEFCRDMIQVRGDGRFGWRPAPALLRGGIVGRARIVGVIRDERDLAAYAANTPGGEAQRAWWWAGGFALVLADVEPLPFVPWRGSLGLFDVPEEAFQLPGRRVS